MIYMNQLFVLSDSPLKTIKHAKCGILKITNLVDFKVSSAGGIGTFQVEAQSHVLLPITVVPL